MRNEQPPAAPRLTLLWFLGIIKSEGARVRVDARFFCNTNCILFCKKQSHNFQVRVLETRQPLEARVRAHCFINTTVRKRFPTSSKMEQPRFPRFDSSFAAKGDDDRSGIDRVKPCNRDVITTVSRERSRREKWSR